MLKFGFVGIGQCGGKIADCFAKLNYPTLAFNTTEKDLNGLEHIAPEYRVKISASGTKGGAGKDPAVGAQGMAEHMDEVMSRINALMEDVDFIFISAGMGGGTGSGATPVLLQQLLEEGRKVGLLLTMPDLKEGVEVKGNAIQSLISIYQLIGENEVPMLIIDNDKVVKKMEQSKDFDWRSVNNNIAKTFNTFNQTANMASPYVTFDEADYLKTLSRAGVFAVTKYNFKIEEILSDTVIPNKIIDFWETKAFNADLAYQEAQMLVTIIEAPESYLKDKGKYKLLEANLNRIRDKVGIASRYEGIYPIKEDRITVYTLLSGMPAPMEKLKAMHEKAQEEEAKILEKIQKTQKSFDLSQFGSVGNVFNKKPIPEKKGLPDFFKKA